MERTLKICHRCKKPSVLWRSNPKTCKPCDDIIKAEAKQGDQKAAPIIAPKGINKLSTKQEKLNAIYLIQNKEYLKTHRFCLAKRACCKQAATEVHHKRGRGPYLLDETTWLPVCKPCHRWIEDHPQEAKKLKLSENRLDKY